MSIKATVPRVSTWVLGPSLSQPLGGGAATLNIQRDPVKTFAQPSSSCNRQFERRRKNLNNDMLGQAFAARELAASGNELVTDCWLIFSVALLAVI